MQTSSDKTICFDDEKFKKLVNGQGKSSELAKKAVKVSNAKLELEICLADLSQLIDQQKGATSKAITRSLLLSFLAFSKLYNKLFEYLFGPVVKVLPDELKPIALELLDEV